MSRRLIAVVLIACIVGAATAIALWARGDRSWDGVGVQPWQEGDPTFAPIDQHPSIVGSNYHGLWDDMTDEVRARSLDELRAAGVEWVRLDISWAELQPTSPDSFDLEWGVPRIEQRIAEINARGMKVLLLVYWGPAWATGTSSKNGVPADPQDYARAMAWVAERWRGQVQAIELWNEPDLETFLANTSVETYTSLVTAAYPAIKAVNPDITVIAGAPTYVKTDWYREFFELGGAGSFDALGVHPYVGQSDQPPETCAQDADIIYYPCNIPNLIQLMRDNGQGDKTIWATEYGWSSHEDEPDAKTWQLGVTEAEQADFLLRMQQYLGQFPEVEASFWYTERNTAKGDVHEDNFGLLTRDFDRKPAYFAIKCAASGVCGPN